MPVPAEPLTPVVLPLLPLPQLVVELEFVFVFVLVPAPLPVPSVPPEVPGLIGCTGVTDEGELGVIVPPAPVPVVMPLLVVRRFMPALPEVAGAIVALPLGTTLVLLPALPFSVPPVCAATLPAASSSAIRLVDFFIIAVSLHVCDAWRRYCIFSRGSGDSDRTVR
jgi:hypothetical protein